MDIPKLEKLLKPLSQSSSLLDWWYQSKVYHTLNSIQADDYKYVLGLFRIDIYYLDEYINKIYIPESFRIETEDNILYLFENKTISDTFKEEKIYITYKNLLDNLKNNILQWDVDFNANPAKEIQIIKNDIAYIKTDKLFYLPHITLLRGLRKDEFTEKTFFEKIVYYKTLFEKALLIQKIIPSDEIISEIDILCINWYRDKLDRLNVDKNIDIAEILKRCFILDYQYYLDLRKYKINIPKELSENIDKWVESLGENGRIIMITIIMSI